MTSHFSQPTENVLRLGLQEGMTVGDCGAGSGHYARAAAAIVGHSGRVYAIDVQEDVLKHLTLNTREHHKNIIKPIWGNIEKLGGTHLQDHILDAAILANVLFQIGLFQIGNREGLREGLIGELKRILKPGGKLMVVDWSGSYGGIGPIKEKVISEQDAENFFINAGFTKVKSFNAGSHHYGIIMTSSL